ncbi:MAG: Cache type 2 domain-containing protein [uncultured Sulfurovum sp.]|uniref:Cache type 2 domain-containing protein n=1 Tax=uncultured Sulfurovum sp. TaxID=269237 RepID=A0A6S6RV54_9BACT|nr:MAG: Cache type 2 domain-containing protein [uncultured Sulfurovum sp.]
MALCTTLSFGFSQEEMDFVSFESSDAEMDEVKAHIEAGVAHCKKVGVAKCVEEFNQKESKWVVGDMYIFANDFDGVIMAHPKKPLKGKNLLDYKDSAGNTLFADFIAKVKADGEGWVDYIWTHPATEKDADKTSFVKGIGENQLIGCGIYHNADHKKAEESKVEEKKADDKK